MSQVVTVNRPSEPRVTSTTYFVGFLASVTLTFIAFLVVTHDLLHGNAALLTIAGLAIAQFIIQVLCFLHLANEARPRLKLMAFLFMLMVVAILAGGSLWIMKNLNYHMTTMNPVEQGTYLHENEGL